METINTVCKYNRRVVVTSAPAAAYNNAKGGYNTAILYNKTTKQNKHNAWLKYSAIQDAECGIK